MPQYFASMRLFYFVNVDKTYTSKCQLECGIFRSLFLLRRGMQELFNWNSA